MVYRFKFLPTVSQSTEAKFITTVKAGKLIIYLGALLEDLEIPQDTATTLLEDNAVAIVMTNAR